MNRLTTLIDALLGLHAALGQLGFDPAEIFVRHSGIVHPVTRLDGAGVVLRTQGKEFTAAVMPCPVDADAFAKAWKQSCERWNGLGQKERDRLYRKHFLSTEASTPIAGRHRAHGDHHARSSDGAGVAQRDAALRRTSTPLVRRWPRRCRACTGRSRP